MFLDLRRAALSLAVLACLMPSPASAQTQTVGLFLNSPGAFPGYTLFGPRDWPVTYLIDMDGNLVHSWQHTVLPKNSNYLLANGHLLRCGKTTNAVFDARGSAGWLQEFDWDGTLLWEYVYSDSQVCGHHDIEPLPNGNLLVVAWEYWSAADAIAAGRDTALVLDALWPEQVVEIERVGTNGANIVWEWHVWDHLVQDYDSTLANYGVVADHPELIDLNNAEDDRTDWLHFNAIAYNPDLDQIALSSNRFQEVWIIDHGTTTAEAAGHTGGARGMGGDILYRWGNPANYGRGADADQVLFGNHNVQWIRAGLPGAGNLLIFNNGNDRWPDTLSYSSVEEVVTTADLNGDYPFPPAGMPHAPAAALWNYTGNPPESFHSRMFGGAQRQPNGNTLIIESEFGRIFELDSSDSLVWEYVIPVGASGPVYQTHVPASNATFRGPRYAVDYPAFTGRDLTPMGPIELDPTFVALGGRAPLRFALRQNHPNPFRPATTIEFRLEEAARVTLDVHDIRGRHIATLLEGPLGAGAHRRTWGADGLPSGVYYYTLRVGPQAETRQMILLR